MKNKTSRESYSKFTAGKKRLSLRRRLSLKVDLLLKPVKGGKKYGKLYILKNCQTHNLCGGGMALESVEPVPRRMLDYLEPARRVEVEIEMPGRAQPIKAEGHLAWVKKAVVHGQLKIQAGVNFSSLTARSAVELYALSIYNFFNRRLIFYMTAAFLVSALLFGAWGAYQKITAVKTARQLTVTEGERKVLENDLKVMLEFKRNLVEEVTALQDKIAHTLVKLNRSEDQYRISRYILSDMSEEWQTQSSSFAVIVNNKYIEGKKFMLTEKYPQAAEVFQSLLRDFPESTVLDRALAQALYKSGRKAEAEKYFNQYITLLNKDIFQ